MGLLTLASVVGWAEIRLKGKISDENNAPVPGAKVSLAAGNAVVRAVSDPTGGFALVLPASGDYLVSVDREGFFKIQDRPVRIDEGARELQLHLNRQREVFESVNVAASPSPIDTNQTAPPEKLTGAEILDIPYPNSRDLRSSLRLSPGVVTDTQGNIHVEGGAEEQTLYTLDGFTINDPLSGQFDSRVSVDAVRSMEINPARLPAEYGKGSAGVLAIETPTGDNRFRYSATNFIPGIQSHRGFGLGNWAPRAGLSGPIARDRAWFSDSFDLEYSEHVVEELPKNQDRNSSWRFSNFLRNQINLSPSNILFTGFLVNYYYAPRWGLSAITPQSTTIDQRARQYFFNIKDQVYFHRGALLEYGYAAHRTAGRQIPQGHGIYIMTPSYDEGNYFVDARRRSGRDQWLANLFLPSFTWAGEHRLKIGMDLDRLEYWQNVDRTGYQQQGFDGSTLRSVTFGGPGRFERSNFEVSSYLQDSWKVRAGLLLEIGLRQDWDEIVHRTNLGPRAGFAWSPPGTKHTKISGGWGIVYDSTSLSLISRPQDQYALVTGFNPDGSLLPGPAPSVFAIYNVHLKSPRYSNWSASVEQELPHRMYARVDYLRKRGRDGFTYYNALAAGLPAPPWAVSAFQTSTFSALYDLGNLRRDAYDSASVSIRKPFGGQYEVMGSYTRSRSFSNAVVDPNIDNPVTVYDNAGRVPWDSPNRFLSWAYLPTPFKNWALAYLWEWHTGFPYSVQTQYGAVVGQVNDYRLPNFFELNVHLERRFVFRKQRWALRGGVNNITGNPNPTEAYNVLGSPVFGHFYGAQGRTFNVRVRWLGRE